MRTCPNCSKFIQDDTIKCPYCGEAANNNDDEVNKLILEMKKKSADNIFEEFVWIAFKLFIAVIAVCIICFIGYLIFD